MSEQVSEGESEGVCIHARVCVSNRGPWSRVPSPEEILREDWWQDPPRVLS